MPPQNIINQSRSEANTITGASISFVSISFSNITETSGSFDSLTVNGISPTWSVGQQRTFTSAGNIPPGWLLENGAAISRTTYSQLFAAIGTLFGNGDGSTTFNLPDSRGRTLLCAGQGGGLTNRSVGNISGTETHTLSTAEIIAHNHSASDAGHIHSTYLRQTGQEVAGYGMNPSAFFGDRVYVDGTTGTRAQTLTSYASISIGNAGGGAAHNNMHPFIVRGVQAIFTGVS